MGVNPQQTHETDHCTGCVGTITQWEDDGRYNSGDQVKCSVIYPDIIYGKSKNNGKQKKHKTVIRTAEFVKDILTDIIFVNDKQTDY